MNFINLLNFKSYALVIALSLLLIYSGCDDTITEDNLPVIPETNVSFSAHLQPVFELKCIPCHNDSRKEGGLSLTTWASTTADPRIVFPGEPDNSVLVWTVEGRAGVSPMPPLNSPYNPFTAEQLKGLKTWIKEGAKNN